MEQNELITMAGVFFGGIILAILGYIRKNPERQTDAVVAGVGPELGRRLQTEMLIAEVKRCADSLAILADRKQAGIEAKLDDIIREMHEAQERERQTRRDR